jgi:hypothetical protein
MSARHKNSLCVGLINEILCFQKAKNLEDQYKHIFGCEADSPHFKYLDTQIHYSRLLNKEWNPMKLGCWQGRLLSLGDWLVLINSALTSLLCLCYYF